MEKKLFSEPKNKTKQYKGNMDRRQHIIKVHKEWKRESEYK